MVANLLYREHEGNVAARTIESLHYSREKWNTHGKSTVVSNLPLSIVGCLSKLSDAKYKVCEYDDTWYQ